MSDSLTKPGKTRRTGWTGLVLVILAAASAATPAADDADSGGKGRRPFRFTAGMEHRSGDYGRTGRTEEVRLPVQLSYRGSQWILSARTHFADITGFSTALDRDAAGSEQSSTTPQAASGIDDLYLSAFHRTLSPKSDFIDLELGIRAKVPLSPAQECLLTNGEIDLTVESRLFSRTRGLEPSVAIGWTRRGDPVRRNASCEVVDGSRVDLNDPFHLRLGVDASLTKALDIEMTYLYREALRPNGPPLRQARVTLEFRLSSSITASVYGGRAFSDAGPDFIGGFGLTHRF